MKPLAVILTGLNGLEGACVPDLSVVKEMRAGSLGDINLVPSQVQHWLESMSNPFRWDAAFLQAFNLHLLWNNFEHVDRSGLEVVRPPLGYLLFYFEWLKGRGEQKVVFDDVLIQGYVVFAEVGLEEVKICEIMAGNGSPAKYKANSTHVCFGYYDYNYYK